MTFTSYAQNFEDILLWRVLHGVECNSYLDIGAQDPIIDSVSYAFYLAGWRGTHVEPTPTYANKLRAARPDETVIEAAVSQLPGPLELHEFPETGLSTGISEIASKHVARGYPARSILVPTVRLENLLEQTGEIAWMKVDVEGMESDVLASWGKCTVRPWILIIEATAPNTQDPTDHEWRDLVTSKGYHEVYWDGLSRYFLHESRGHLAAAFKHPISIFDNFLVDRHHFVTRSLTNDLELAERQLEDQRALESELRLQVSAFEDRLTIERSQISSLQSQLLELEASLKVAEANEVCALQELAKVEREHRVSLENWWKAREESEGKLRSTVRDAEASETSARYEIGQLQERISQLLQESERDRTQLGQELARQHSALIRADSLIRGAMGAIPGRRRQFAEILGLVDRSPAWSALSTWSLPAPPPSLGEVARNRSESQTKMPTQGTHRNPYMRADSLAELLEWNDLEFVRCAYVTLLGRQPDKEGEQYYTRRIREGRSKTEILWQLRRSGEGLRHDPGIAGLDRALKWAAWERTPIVGALVRIRSGASPDDRIARIQRSLTNELHRVRNSYSQGHRAAATAEAGSASDQSNPESISPASLPPTNLSPASRKAFDILKGS